eukprot:1486897-Heterocapsa_arctica.AAC.1
MYATLVARLGSNTTTTTTTATTAAAATTTATIIIISTRINQFSINFVSVETSRCQHRIRL